VLALTVVILILAATAVPWFSTPDARAKDTALRFNLNMVRSQIEAYKNQHDGASPRLALFASQMTQCTSPAGRLTGKNLTCGPYFQGQIPINPFNGSNLLTSVAKPEQTPTAAVPGRAGWLYDETTGALFPNNPEYYSRQR
jgi:type II secretory pathway pseudopilin PulG